MDQSGSKPIGDRDDDPWTIPGASGLLGAKFSPLQYTESGRFTLVKFRHMGQWGEVAKRLPLREFLAWIEDSDIFSS
jgi:hypothetical protein